jgi:hypothetical protein
MPAATTDRLVTIVRFDASPASGRYVKDGYAHYPNALLFRAGKYESHNYEMTPDEIRDACGRFRPISGNILHSKFLQGRAVHLDSIRVDAADPARLRGAARVPLGLDELLDDDERQLSCEWDRATKDLGGLSLVVNPRVPGASLIAGFADMHDVDPDLDDRALAAFTHRKRTEHGDRHAQIIHDVIGAAFPEFCAGPGMPPPAVTPPATPATMAAFADRPAQQKFFKKCHDDACMHGATCPGKPAAAMSATDPADPPPVPTTQRNIPMSKDALIRAIGALPDAPSDVTEAHVKAVTAAFAATIPAALLPKLAAFSAPEPEPESPRERKLREDVESLQAQREADRKAAVEDKAAAFALDLFKVGKLLPKAVPFADALYRELADDDHAHAKTVSFGDEADRKTGNRLALFSAFAAALPGHGLYDPAITGDVKIEDLKGAKILFNADGMPKDPDAETPLTEERKQQLLDQTLTGRQMAANKKAS